MGDIDATFDRARKPPPTHRDDDNAAVSDQLQRNAGPQVQPGATGTSRPPSPQSPRGTRTLDHGVVEGKKANDLLGLVRTTLFPAYRRAVDAVDPLAALELARHVVGSIKVIEDARQEVLLTLPVDDAHHYMVSIPGEPELSKEQVTAKYQELVGIKIGLLADLPALESELALKIGPQMFRDQPVLGAFTPPVLGKDPCAYLSSEAGAAVELISVVVQIRNVSGATPGTCPNLDPQQRQAIVALIEPWKGRPVNFAFLVRVLQDEGVWEAVAHEVGKNGMTLEQTGAAVAEQAKATGELADVGELDTASLNGLFGIDPGDPARFESGPPAIDDGRAMDIFNKLRDAAPDARGPLIRQIDQMRELGELCNHLPWKYVQAMHDSIAPFDAHAAALLAPYYQDKGGGESMHQIYMDQVNEDLEEGHEIRAFGWFFLDTLHNAFTGGFEHEYSEAYDAHEQGWTTDDQFSSQATKALGKAAAITAVSAITGGVAGEFAEGAAAGLGASRSAAQIIGGGVGGFAAGVSGHLTGDVYDQLLNGKQGFDDFGEYMKSGAMGGAMGTVLAGVSVGAGQYLGSGPRPIDAFAERYPRMSKVLEDIRATGFRSGAAVRMKVSDLLDLMRSGFGGPGGGLSFAYAGAYGDVRALPPDTEISVGMRPLRPLTQPMQMSSINGGGGADVTDATTKTEPAAPTVDHAPEGPFVAIDKIEVVGPDPAMSAPADPAVVDGTSMPAGEWVERLKAQMTTHEVSQYELMQGKWKSPEEMQQAFDGNFDAARQAVDNALAQKTGAQVIKDVSAKRVAQIRDFVKSRGILKESEATEILARLSEHPSKGEIGEAARELRTIVVDEFMAQQNAARYPGARVLREVKVLEEQPDVSVDEFRAMARDDKQGLTLRKGADGKEHVFREVTDIDALVVAPGASGKEEILRFEQQKAGTTDTHAAAKSQNDRAIAEIDAALAGRKSIRLEIGDNDITSGLDLTSSATAAKVTVGPAGKGFDESIEVTANDLERLMKELVTEAKKSGGGT